MYKLKKIHVYNLKKINYMHKKVYNAFHISQKRNQRKNKSLSFCYLRLTKQFCIALSLTVCRE